MAEDDISPDTGRKRGTRKGNDARVMATAKASTEAHLVLHKKSREMDEATKKMVVDGMKHDRICAMLEEKDFQAILQTMEYYEFKANDPVVRQGDVGQIFFVTHAGQLEVSMNDQVVNTMGPGNAFGGLSLIYNCPRTASVTAVVDSSCWGVTGDNFRSVLQDNAKSHYSENRKFLDSIKLFDGLPARQKDRVADSLLTEVFETGQRVVTQGELAGAMYFVKKGEMTVIEGGTIGADGAISGGNAMTKIGVGASFGERGLLYNEPRTSTVVAESRCELLCIAGESLKEVFGDEVSACLERSFILAALQKSPMISQFSDPQQTTIVGAMSMRVLKSGEKIQAGLRFAVVVDGVIEGSSHGNAVSLPRASWYEEDALPESAVGMDASMAIAEMQKNRGTLQNLQAGTAGAKLCVLTMESFNQVLKDLGLTNEGSEEEAVDITRKMMLARKVHIFRHLNEDQMSRLVKSFKLQKYAKNAIVLKQGELGTTFCVIASGEVRILIDGNPVRTLAKNAYIGERALLFDEPRSATVEVTSNEADIWFVEKATFTDIVKGNMQEDLMHRIRLQDTSVTMKDLKCIKIVGAGAAGVVRLVEHKTTKTRYALKRVMKQGGKVPEEVKRECELLAENDHPFIMHLVKTFETPKSVYMLTELITGGELHAAIRTVPTVLSRSQGQFYTGSLVLVLEALTDRNIVYRDLKPENVMLDAQGYLKLIDFGIAKKLEEGKMRTYTMIGTPHYMAPEVMRGHGYSTEIDIWSLGVLLFELVCGYLPFADDLDEPTEVCTAVLRDPLSFPSGYKDKHGRELMQGMMCRQPKKRIGSGLNGYDDIKNAQFFKIGHESSSVFTKILGRELRPPVVPHGECYCDPEDVADLVISDNDVLG